MLIARCGARPWMRTAYHLLAYRLGAFSAYLDIDWRRVNRLVIVCHGNICRSPYAELRARQLGLAAISFGLRASPGACADTAALRNAARRGTDMAAHRSRSIDGIAVYPSDLFVAMELRHAKRLSRFAQEVGAQLTLQGIWAATPRPYVPDPYGCTDLCFQYSYALIDSSLERMKRMIRGPGTGRRGRKAGPARHPPAAHQSGQALYESRTGNCPTYVSTQAVSPCQATAVVP